MALPVISRRIRYAAVMYLTFLFQTCDGFYLPGSYMHTYSIGDEIYVKGSDHEYEGAAAEVIGTGEEGMDLISRADKNKTSGYEIIVFEVVFCSVKYDPEKMAKLHIYDNFTTIAISMGCLSQNGGSPVFREPNHSMLLCVMIGDGVQITGMAVVSIFCAALGFMSPASRVPLTLSGGLLGTRAEPIQYPVRTNQIPREIPARKYPSWLLILGAGTLPFGTLFIELFFILSSIWLGRFYYVFGFLLIVLILLVIVRAEVSVASHTCISVMRIGCGGGKYSMHQVIIFGQWKNSSLQGTENSTAA
ncbi:unnamed protein product [Fraxinus pennsylvanica]|uniref:Transmembrane 9 superfamily member n=1 Tax=Fraxinus pennsylvanica TaxID=56036 RepID=A0AAD2DJQ5_9LAMI|nr:unnamed protein product [Fraxinus pennsylvanica]